MTDRHFLRADPGSREGMRSTPEAAALPREPGRQLTLLLHDQRLSSAEGRASEAQNIKKEGLFS